MAVKPLYFQCKQRLADYLAALFNIAQIFTAAITVKLSTTFGGTAFMSNLLQRWLKTKLYFFEALSCLADYF